MPCPAFRSLILSPVVAAFASLLLVACAGDAQKPPPPKPKQDAATQAAEPEDNTPARSSSKQARRLVPKPEQKPANPAAEPIAPVNWPLQSAFSSRLRFIGEQGLHFVEILSERSSGTLNLKFFEPGAHVAGDRVAEAVATGRLPAGFISPAFLANDEPALAIFAGTPFGPSVADHYAWLRDGGGQSLQDTLYARHNLKGMPCVIAGASGVGWFRKPLRSPLDARNLRIRAVGLSAEVLQELGGMPQAVSGADLYPALVRGTLDAVSFAMPYVDVDMGFDRIAKTYYYPGALLPFSVYDIVINRDRWQALAPQHQRLIEQACHDNIRHGLDLDAELTAEALATIRARGVTVAPLPPVVEDAARKAWIRVAARQSAQNDDFARIYLAYRRYLTKRPSGDPLN